MKLLILFNILMCHGEYTPIKYLCDKCDLYDLDTATFFEELAVPELRGPRPHFNTTQHSDEQYPEILVDQTTLMCAAGAAIIGLINLVATVTILVTERKISASARKTYLQTAILENE